MIKSNLKLVSSILFFRQTVEFVIRELTQKIAFRSATENASEKLRKFRQESQCLPFQIRILKRGYPDISPPGQLSPGQLPPMKFPPEQLPPPPPRLLFARQLPLYNFSPGQQPPRQLPSMKFTPGQLPLNNSPLDNNHPL